MRKEANLNGKKIALIPNGDKVVFLKEAGPDVTIANTTGKWTFVRWQDKQGWVFGGFLTLAEKGDEGHKAPFDTAKLESGIPQKWVMVTGTAKTGWKRVIPCRAALPGIEIVHDHILFSYGHFYEKYFIANVQRDGADFVFSLRYAKDNAIAADTKKIHVVRFSFFDPETMIASWSFWGGFKKRAFFVAELNADRIPMQREEGCQDQGR